jgi:hypothetical protein
MLCTESVNFAEMKKVIEQLCHSSKNCDYATKEKLAAFFDRVERVAKKQTLVKPI